MLNEGSVSAASNIKDGTNPPYTLDNFYSMFPAFGPQGTGENETFLVPEVVLTMFLNLAHATVKQARWHGSWELAMGWFIAHFATLHLQSVTGANSSAETVISNAQARGLVTSSSVGDISESVDYNTVANDLSGWAQWKLTQFGVQFASMAKLLGLGGMVVR